MSVVSPYPIVRLATLAHPAKGSMAGGPFGSDLVSRDYVAEGVPVVRGTNLPKDQKFSLDGCVFVSETKADALHLNCAFPGDIVFTQRGTLGQVGLIPSDTPYSRFLISQSQMKMKVDPAKADSRFIYYYFRLPSTVSHVENHALQSGVPHINLGILRRLEIICPSLKVQQKIAAILSAYDDLIANNQRRITLLERMAEDIYREWFVRLRFPGHENVKIEKGVPQGWKMSEIRDVCSTLKRGIAPNYTESKTTLVVNQRCIRDGAVDLAEARGHETKVSDEKLLQYGDVLINSTGVGTLGRVAVFDHELTNATCDTHVTICRANQKEVTLHYLGQAIWSLQEHFESMAVGSTGQSELGRDVVGGTTILLAPLLLQKSFSNSVEPMLKRKRLLRRQTEALATARDALLPRLISGKLSVDTLDIRFPPGLVEVGVP